MDEIYAALERCGLFLAIGTSGEVYPAAGFVLQCAAAAPTPIPSSSISSRPATSPCSRNTSMVPRRSTVPPYVERVLTQRLAE